MIYGHSKSEDDFWVSNIQEMFEGCCGIWSGVVLNLRDDQVISKTQKMKEDSQGVKGLESELISFVRQHLRALSILGLADSKNQERKGRLKQLEARVNG